MASGPSLNLTADQSLLKRINRMALVRLVKTHPGLSRASLAKQTGLTKSTVSVLAQGLIDEGWLRERGTVVGQGLGRRPTPLELDPARLGFLGAELGVDRLNAIACNLRGDIVFSRMLRLQHDDAASLVGGAGALVAEARAALLAQGYRPLGIGVGVPGSVDARDGTLRFAPNIGWRDVAIEQLLCAELDRAGCHGLPVSIVNDANAGALSEYVFGASQASGPLVYINMGVGLGAGIVLGDRLYLGADGLAGELGHTTLQLDGPVCACGRTGCVESFISQRAISRLVTDRDDPVLSFEELTSRIGESDPIAMRAATTVGKHLGLLMHNLNNTINPATIVLGGPLTQLGDSFVQNALAAMREQSGRYGHHRVSVRLCRFGIDACAVGAAGSVLHEMLHPLSHPDPERVARGHWSAPAPAN